MRKSQDWRGAAMARSCGDGVLLGGIVGRRCARKTRLVVCGQKVPASRFASFICIPSRYRDRIYHRVKMSTLWPDVLSSCSRSAPPFQVVQLGRNLRRSKKDIFVPSPLQNATTVDQGSCRDPASCSRAGAMPFCWAVAKQGSKVWKTAAVQIQGHCGSLAVKSGDCTEDAEGKREPLEHHQHCLPLPAPAFLLSLSSR